MGPTVAIVYASLTTEIADIDRRASIFDGDLVVYGPRLSTLALADLAHTIVEQMLGDNPQWAQQRLSETEFTTLFRAAARNFSRQRRSMEVVSRLVEDFGCDPAATFIGQVSLSATTGHGFLPHGIGTPQHPHRDTWFAASPCQINWRCPLYTLDASSTIAFHPRYWDWPIPNSSVDFDYEQWQEGADKTRASGDWEKDLTGPRALDTVELNPDIRIACPSGGMVLSSVAQLQSTVPNDSLITYFSAQFQTVNLTDLTSGFGPSNIDASPRGSSLSTFVRCSDFKPMPSELVQHELERRHLDPDPHNKS